MQLYLLRHGIAEEGGAGMNDADRSLTTDGRRKLKQVLQAAVEAQVKPALILTSPLKRAVQTAELAKGTLGYKDEILRTKALVPGSTVELVWDEIRVHKDKQSLMLVGHNPLFDSLGGYLLGQPGLQLDFKKGAILRIDVDTFSTHPKGVLRWYLTPKLAASRQ
jgi:phosphohistidine phosphatase